MLVKTPEVYWTHQCLHGWQSSTYKKSLLRKTICLDMLCNTVPVNKPFHHQASTFTAATAAIPVVLFLLAVMPWKIVQSHGQSCRRYFNVWPSYPSLYTNLKFQQALRYCCVLWKCNSVLTPDFLSLRDIDLHLSVPNPSWLSLLLGLVIQTIKPKLKFRSNSGTSPTLSKQYIL